MNNRQQHNFTNILMYTLTVYISLIPFVNFNNKLNYQLAFEHLSISILIGLLFNFFNNIIIELRKVNGEKFPDLDNECKPMIFPYKEGKIALLSDIPLEEPDFTKVPKGILSKEKIEKYREMSAKLRGEEYKEPVEHKQFHPSDLSLAQQEKFNKWKSELPKARTREDGIFHYIYSHGSGIGWSLTVRRGKTNKFEIDLTEYETW